MRRAPSSQDRGAVIQQTDGRRFRAVCQPDAVQPGKEPEVAALSHQCVRVRHRFQRPVTAPAAAPGDLGLDLLPRPVTDPPQPVQTLATRLLQFQSSSALISALARSRASLADRRRARSQF